MARELRVCAGEGFGESRGFCRDGDQMDMIRHETVSPECQVCLGGLGSQQIQVQEMIGLGEEDLLAAVAALSDVASHAG